jgi:hypothetical protein
MDPVVLMRGGPKPAGGLYVRLAAEDEARVSPQLLEFLARVEQALVSRGFATPLRATNEISVDVKSLVTLLEHPGDAAIAYCLISVGKHTGVSVAATIRSDFADGVQLYTSNSRTIQRMPPRPEVDAAQFPDVRDAGALYDIHRARVLERAKSVATVPLTRGPDPLAYQDHEARAIQAFWVRKGYYRWADGDKIDRVWRGAILSAWRGLYPWKQITEGKSARKRAAITRRLGPFAK